ncbi:MAG: ribose-phosphate diphosphokinase [Desulfurococcaceae archaeon]
MSGKPLVLGGTNGEHLAVEIASAAGYELGSVEVKRFPDDELYIRVMSEVSGRDVVYVNSLQRGVNDSLVETLYTLDTLKDLGARRVVAVIPYMSYARQDSRFNPGECVSVQVLAKLFRSVSVDHIITVDMHLHRISDPNALFGAAFHNITGVRELAKHFRGARWLERPTVIGPDEEAEQWAKVMAEELGRVGYGVLEKRRLSPEQVVIEAKGVDVKDKDVVIVDDIISTGGTIVEAVKALRGLGARRIGVGVVHAILVGNAYAKLLRLGLEELVATNTVLSPISRISVAPAIVEELRKIL